MIDRNERIAERAYRIWEDAGRPEGQDVEHWLSAEAELAEAGPADEEGAVAPPRAATGAPSAATVAAPVQKRGLAA
jgi:hypothetical protein